MIIVAHILGFALIFIASSFDFMNFSLKASNLQFFVDLPWCFLIPFEAGCQADSFCCCVGEGRPHFSRKMGLSIKRPSISRAG